MTAIATVISYLKDGIDCIEKQLNRRVFIIYFILLLFYFAIRFFETTLIQAHCTFPLTSLYIVNNLLFIKNSINLELAKTVINPCNGTFIYPPGIYLLMKILGLNKVSDIFSFLFLIQLFVPVLIFHLLRSVSSILVSLLIALLSIKYFTNSNWWGPDWIIQPIMLVAVLLLYTSHNDKIGIVRLIIIGLLSGFIMLLKHNIGVFFILSCITWIFFHYLKIYENKINKPLSPFLFIILAGYLSFGIIFSLKVLFFDEIIFYLFPYFIFWITITYLITKKRLLLDNVPEFLKEISIFCLSSLLLPIGIFFLVGSVVGYSRYWHSLFGMGFQYLPTWDWGIKGTIKNIVEFKDIKTIYLSSSTIVLFLFPFVVNCFAVTKILYAIRNSTSIEIKKYLKVTSLGIICVFMFFPLESYGILVSKLFLFCFILFFILKSGADKFSVFIKLILITLFIPVALHAAIKPFMLYKIDTVSGSEKVQRIIGMPLERRLADEFDKQVSVIEQSIKGGQYYVVGYASANLLSLKTFVNDHYPQYYTEMRDTLLNQEMTDAIIESFRKLPFVVVGYNEYQKYLLKQENNPFMFEIIEFISRNFHEIARYEAPNDLLSARVQSFIVMKNSHI